MSENQATKPVLNRAIASDELIPTIVDPQMVAVISMIKALLPNVDSVAAAADLFRENLTVMQGGAPDEKMQGRIELAVTVITESLENVEVVREHSIFNGRQKWYEGPDASSRHWMALSEYLLRVKKFPEETVESINETSTEIVSLIENPIGGEFACRGLVVGYVQSGKTANMTAVIAKAVDAGYDLIVILAGLTDKLRQQTQRRIESDIVARNPELWVKLTTSDIKGDFQRPPQGGLVHNKERAQILVTKKNVGPLRSLRDTIEGTMRVELQKHRVLIIDDECDQASVNSANSEFDVTAINALIRVILSKLPRVSYIGYTATPFANVLINPYAARDVGTPVCDEKDPTKLAQGLDDLYPRDFITSLPVPIGYFGTEKLFGRISASADTDDEGLDVLRIVPDEDSACLQPASRKDMLEFEVSIPPSLEEAILYFLITCSVRRLRGQENSHMTMLIHTSPYVDLHGKVASVIRKWLALYGADLQNRNSDIVNRLADLWRDEVARTATLFPELLRPDFDEIVSEFPKVLGNLEIAIENGSSNDRIEYSGHPKTYIVVGGSVLARGLTLEGLAVSYFLRSAKQYDTLLQMGRWFGFRIGYGDLPRVWMPLDLQINFRALASIESEIREDISRYVDESVTPEEFAVRIRQIPGMAITAASKMRHAEEADISYWGRHVQTIRFDISDRGKLVNRWEAGALLFNSGVEQGLEVLDVKGGRLLKGVPCTSIENFLGALNESAGDTAVATALLDFVKGASDQLAHWNVGIVEPSNGPESEDAMGVMETVKLVTRSRMRDTPDDDANIKALMSLQDVLFDLPAEDRVGVKGENWDSLKFRRNKVLGEVPLLLLYAIDQESTPQGSSKSSKPTLRVPLNAGYHVLGVGIVFPKPKGLSGRSVSVRLQAYTPEQLDAFDEESKAEIEAASGQ